jgi:hypothetical protein
MMFSRTTQVWEFTERFVMSGFTLSTTACVSDVFCGPKKSALCLSVAWLSGTHVEFFNVPGFLDVFTHGERKSGFALSNHSVCNGENQG